MGFLRKILTLMALLTPPMTREAWWSRIMDDALRWIGDIEGIVEGRIETDLVELSMRPDDKGYGVLLTLSLRIGGKSPPSPPT